MATKKQLQITALPDDHIQMLKIIRTIGNKSLREAKEIYQYLADSLPCILIAGVDKSLVLDLAEKINAAGGQCDVQDTILDHPLVLCPEGNKPFEWHWFYGPRASNS